jgi:hypothetical protein
VAKGDKEYTWQESTTAAEDVIQDNKGKQQSKESAKPKFPSAMT